MKKILLLAMLVGAGCSSSPGFAGIKEGMNRSAVLRLVGPPDRRQPMGTVEWWLYKDRDKHIIVMDHDTVANCTTQQEAMKIMNDALQAVDSLKKNK